MRIVSRTTRSLLEQKREKSLRRRVAAGNIAKAYPRVELVRLQLRFLPVSGSVPAAQIHALYPSAPAYFEFACPYGDCDGSFDLNAVVQPFLAKAGSQTDGTLLCSGTRTAAGMTRQPCKLRADYWVSAQHQAISRAAG
jgi:hypothetical protein